MVHGIMCVYGMLGHFPSHNIIMYYFSLPEVAPPTLSVSSQALIRNILLIVGYLFRENKRYLPDYRIALLKTATMARPSEVWTTLVGYRLQTELMVLLKHPLSRSYCCPSRYSHNIA